MKKTLKKVGRNPMKKNNKRTKKGAIIALCMAGAIAISGAFAFLSDSESAINRFTFADEKGEQTVDVRIDEPNWHEENGQKILPLDTVAKDPKVVNEGENDVYAFVTVLVPTAKSIKLNRDDGTLYTAENVELFSYEVNDGWVEVDKTSKDTEGQFVTTKGEVVTSNAALGLDGRNIVIVGDKAITNKKVNSNEAKDNIYFTAHTYAYTGETSTTTMARISRETSSVFNEVTIINIDDGAREHKTLEEVKAGLVAEDGTTIEIVDDTIVATKDGNQKVIYRTVGDAVIDVNGNIQYNSISQFVKDNNINIYVDTYAIQADNLNTADINGVWDICVNTTAGNSATDAGSFDYFRTVTNDVGHKQAFAPATSA